MRARPGYGGPALARAAPGVAGRAGRAGATSAGDPLVGCFGNLNMNKRIPQLLEAFALLRERRPGARLLLVGAAAERFDLERRLERLGLGGDALIREEYVPEERLWSLMAACDVLVNLRSPTMGETSGAVIRGLVARQADARLRRRLVRRAAGRRRAARSRSTSTRCRRSRRALELAADHAAELGAAGARLRPRASTTSAASPTPTRAALEEAAGGDAVTDAVLWRIAEAAAEVGLDDAAELAARAREAGLVA